MMRSLRLPVYDAVSQPPIINGADIFGIAFVEIAADAVFRGAGQIAADDVSRGMLPVNFGENFPQIVEENGTNLLLHQADHVLSAVIPPPISPRQEPSNCLRVARNGTFNNRPRVGTIS